MADQIRHYEDVLESERAASPEAKRIVIGHSIGCYFGLEALKSQPPGSVETYIGLMPFFEANAANKNYRRMEFLLSFFWPLLYVFGVIADLVGRLPRPWQNRVMAGHTAKMDAYNADYTVGSMLSFGMICQYLHLGKTEFRNHKRPFDFAARFAPWKGRSSLLYTDGDLWAPESMCDRAKKSGVPVTFMAGVPHAFGVEGSSSEKMATWTFSQLAAVVARVEGAAAASTEDTQT